MDLELPSWLDATFMAAALQGGEEPSQGPRVTVKEFHASLAVAAGNNYSSRLYRVKVHYSVEDEGKSLSLSLIVKDPFTNGVIKEMTDPSEFFGKEPEVYGQLMPIMSRIVGCEFAPKSFYTSDNLILVLEDLKQQGYEMCDKYKQLDFPHCEQVFRTLAKFHAASVVCKKENPDLISLVSKETVYSEGDKFNSTMRLWMQLSFTTVSSVVEEMKLGKDAVELLSSRADTIADSTIRLCKPKEVGLNVLNHGDLWGNNILFKHTSSGDIVDVKFIDYQASRYCSPALDLLYFIWSSANEDVRESRLPELYEVYRRTLNTTLERLGCEERLTAEELKKDLADAADWAALVVSTLLPIIICESGDVLNTEEYNPEEFTDSDSLDKYYKLYNGKYYRALLPKIMEQLLRFIYD